MGITAVGATCSDVKIEVRVFFGVKIWASEARTLLMGADSDVHVTIHGNGFPRDDTEPLRCPWLANMFAPM